MKFISVYKNVIKPVIDVAIASVTLLLLSPVMLVIALWQALTFHLNKQTHKIFVDEVERLKAHGSKQDVTPQARHVVEDLTGYSYDDLWNEPQNAESQTSRPARAH